MVSSSVSIILDELLVKWEFSFFSFSSISLPIS